MDSMEYKPFNHAYHTMQQELVHILQQRICWADKEQVAYALARVRMDYQDLEHERRSIAADHDEHTPDHDIRVDDD